MLNIVMPMAGRGKRSMVSYGEDAGASKNFPARFVPNIPMTKHGGKSTI